MASPNKFGGIVLERWRLPKAGPIDCNLRDFDSNVPMCLCQKYELNWKKFQSHYWLVQLWILTLSTHFSLGHTAPALQHNRTLVSSVVKGQRACSYPHMANHIRTTSIGCQESRVSATVSKAGANTPQKESVWESRIQAGQSQELGL